MNIEAFFKTFKSEKRKDRSIDEDLFKFNEFKFDGYDIGVVSNLNKHNKYEVFLYVEANNDIISNLLYSEKDSSFDATSYFEELSALASTGNLEKIALRINSSNK